MIQYSLSNIIFLVFASVLVTVVVYLAVLIVVSVYIRMTAREMAIFSVIMFLFGFSVASYLDMNAVDLFVSGIILVMSAIYFSYRAIRKKLLENQVRSGGGMNA